MRKEIDKLANVFWRIIAEVAQKDIKKAVKSYVLYVQKKGLSRSFDSILNAIEKKGEQVLKAKQANVKTAFKISDKLEKRIEKEVDAEQMIFEVDKSLIGGIEIQTADIRIRASIKSQLEKLKAGNC